MSAEDEDVLHVNADVLHGAEQMRMLIHAEVLRKARDVEDGMSCATQDALLARRRWVTPD